MTNYQRYVFGNLDGFGRVTLFGIASDVESYGVKKPAQTEFGRHRGWKIDFEDTQCD